MVRGKGAELSVLTNSPVPSTLMVLNLAHTGVGMRVSYDNAALTVEVMARKRADAVWNFMF